MSLKTSKTTTLAILFLAAFCFTGCGDGSNCGNALVEAEEECDDGNILDGDGCDTNCTFTSCGNGIKDQNEICDDGNQSNDDDCVEINGDCQVARCGDGFTQISVEECDDGNTDDTDDCTNSCRLATCGDGFEQLGEECDDGDDDNTDTCTNSCTDADCGDGFLQASNGEECDDANDIDEDGCANNCQIAFCGDGITREDITDPDDEFFESCDDANASNFDDCTTNCEIAFCGDGIAQLEAGEECDEGDQNSDTGSCTSNCQNAICGDSLVRDGAEECDDGNNSNEDDCTNACLDSQCGDTFVQFGVEECDDGNIFNDDDCSNFCFLPICGDGILQPQTGEECDDSDSNDADDCPNTCRNAFCGDGFVQLGIEDCDDGNDVPSDGCENDCSLTCGNGVVDVAAGEACDDGNTVDGDGCNNDCTETQIVQLATGSSHTCALLNTGDVRCWGRGNFGQLGYENTNDIGDNEAPANAGNVNLGGTVTQLVAGNLHNCALLNTGDVRCWGAGNQGELGYANINTIGDNEAPASVGNVELGGVATQLAAGSAHTCALLNTGDVRCWGRGTEGQLGYENIDNIGDNETPADVGNVDIGGIAIQVSTGGQHTCALLNTGEVRCWGNSASGQLGYGNTDTIGDDESPASVGNVNVGDTVIQLTAGFDHTCALLDTGEARCWGRGAEGQLGYANTNNIGDNESPASAGNVNVGDTVTQLVAGGSQTCALLDTGNVRCWGNGLFGKLGYANENNIGDDESPASVGNVDVGDTVTQLATGSSHTCALLNTGDVRCWGRGNFGQLGYENTNNIGDDETPASTSNAQVGDISIQVVIGNDHTCALLDTGEVRCWGRGAEGQLGYANIDTIGDDESPASVGNVDVGGIVTQITAGAAHTCALLDTGSVRCWGNSASGQLGYANTDTIGDDESPASVGNVDVGGTVTQITAGFEHTCALLNTGNVRCWGNGDLGQLGYANIDTIGDDESPASAGNVDVGGTVTQLAAGGLHTCALLDTGNVRCWGSSFRGQLGYGGTTSVGDDESPASAGNVDVGGIATQLTTGAAHTCALLDTGGVRCWGSGFNGRLGYGNLNAIGDDESPASIGNVDVGGTVTQLIAGSEHTCALLSIGNIRCWGNASSGQLGYANANTVGDNETPSSAGNVDVGGIVTQIAAGRVHTCALLDTGNVRCWGAGGHLGYANIDTIGDNEPPSSAGNVDVGGIVIQMAKGSVHTCALLNTSNVRCWGNASFGQLGYGNTDTIGDDESPASIGNVDVGGTVVQLATGAAHTCALLDTGNVRCWGKANLGQLGYENTNDIGDNELPVSAGNVNVGGTVVQLATGADHTCALLDTGNVRCWGNAFRGQLGYGTIAFGGNLALGDTPGEMPPPDVDIGGTVIQLTAGNTHTCALLNTGDVRCWGDASFGQLGYANTNRIGDNETPSSAGSILLDGFAIQLIAGSNHTCALLNTGNVRCWGNGSAGQLGYNNTENIGDTEFPASVGNVNVGGFVVEVTAGNNHTCAFLDTGEARCWGDASFGQLGYGNTNNVGDNEAPFSVGSVSVGDDVLLLEAGGDHTCAALDNGLVRCWGRNSFGQLGNVSTANIGDDEIPTFELIVQVF